MAFDEDGDVGEGAETMGFYLSTEYCETGF